VFDIGELEDSLHDRVISKLFILDLFVLYHGDDLKEVAATNLIALL
jgi:hypothetical protein